jgi:hypothetical protein
MERIKEILPAENISQWSDELEEFINSFEFNRYPCEKRILYRRATLALQRVRDAIEDINELNTCMYDRR